mmetsp:Transcript_60464/g.160767  ORF Transcript_60464/g.160767 Transcript_60464/m.160767 type:complete len:253 (-) Transcript_60464:657-1415(-)
MSDPEAHLVAIVPLQVVEQRPSKVALHGYALPPRLCHVREILVIVVHAHGVIENVWERYLGFALHVNAVLGDHELLHVSVPRVNVKEATLDAPRHDVEPGRLLLWPDERAVVSLMRGRERRHHTLLCPNPRGGVVVHPVKIKGALEFLALLGRKLRKILSKETFHALWIISGEVYGVCKPSEVEVVVQLGRVLVSFAARVVRLSPIVVQGDAYFAQLIRLVLRSVQPDCCGVRQQHVVPAQILGGSRVRCWR